MRSVGNCLTAEDVNRIVGFLGYGRLSAPVWFIGVEEGLGNMHSDDALDNLKARGKFESVMDLREAHLSLKSQGKFIDVELSPPGTQVWRFMAKIMLARSKDEHWMNRKKAKDYVMNHLGRSNGDVFLTELSPIPTRRTVDKSWRREFEESLKS